MKRLGTRPAKVWVRIAHVDVSHLPRPPPPLSTVKVLVDCRPDTMDKGEKKTAIKKKIRDTQRLLARVSEGLSYELWCNLKAV